MLRHNTSDCITASRQACRNRPTHKVVCSLPVKWHIVTKFLIVPLFHTVRHAKLSDTALLRFDQGGTHVVCMSNSHHFDTHQTALRSLVFTGENMVLCFSLFKLLGFFHLNFLMGQLEREPGVDRQEMTSDGFKPHSSYWGFIVFRSYQIPSFHQGGFDSLRLPQRYYVSCSDRGLSSLRSRSGCGETPDTWKPVLNLHNDCLLIGRAESNMTTRSID